MNLSAHVGRCAFGSIGKIAAPTAFQGGRLQGVRRVDRVRRERHLQHGQIVHRVAEDRVRVTMAGFKQRGGFGFSSRDREQLTLENAA